MAVVRLNSWFHTTYAWFHARRAAIVLGLVVICVAWVLLTLAGCKSGEPPVAHGTVTEVSPIEGTDTVYLTVRYDLDSGDYGRHRAPGGKCQVGERYPDCLDGD